MNIAGPYAYLAGNPETDAEETPQNHPKSLTSQLREVYGNNGNGNSSYHDLNGGIRNPYAPYSEVERYISQVNQPRVTLDYEAADLLQRSGYDTAVSALKRESNISNASLNFPFAFSPEELKENQLVRNAMAGVFESFLKQAEQRRVYFPIPHTADKHGYTAATAAAWMAMALRNPISDINVEICEENKKGQLPRLRIMPEQAEEISEVSNAWKRYIEILMVTKNMEMMPRGFNMLTDKLGQDVIALAGYCGIPPGHVFISKKDRKKGFDFPYPGLAQRFEKMVETKGYDLARVRKAYEEIHFLFRQQFHNWDPQSTEVWSTVTPAIDPYVQPQSDFRPYDLFLENCAWQRLAKNVGTLHKGDITELYDVVICRKPTAVVDSVAGSNKYKRKPSKNPALHNTFDAGAILTVYMAGSVFVVPRSHQYQDEATFFAYGKAPKKGKMGELANQFGIRALTRRQDYFV